MSADLTGSLSFKPGAYKTGDIVSGSFTLQNLGSSTITSSFNVAIHLSTDKTYGNADDLSLANIPVSTDIPGHLSVNFSADAPLPAIAPGTAYYVAIKLDSANKVAESNESNNYLITDLAAIQVVNSSGALPVIGTDNADKIIVSKAPGVITVEMNGTKTNYSTNVVTTVIVLSGAGDDSVTIGNGITNDYVYGGDGNDTIVGGDGVDTLSGGANKDRLYGAQGNDVLRGNGGNDALFGQDGVDRLFGGTGNDWLDGGSSNDRLQGDSDNDTMYGQSGNDHFFAKADGGIDSLIGGSGTDDAQRDSGDIVNSIEVLS
ncbi:MAG TPA: calcium-binding protein [Tepidisphaeraceae bacterium]|nr:calcium-binding protein [Tepidisphaeraceae bacterium]